MFSQRRKSEFLGKEFTWFWAALAFQAGYVNAAGFLASARFVSHMTGFGTQVGISLSTFDYAMAIEMLSAPLSFLLGACTSAILVDVPLMGGRKPKYLWVMAGILAIYVLATFGGLLGWFGTFGEPLLHLHDFVLMSALCFVCGLQNACFASLTRGQIRTTHLTGILTDIGTTLVKTAVAARPREKIVLRRNNRIRILTFTSFSFGSATSAVIMSRLGYHGLGVLIGTSSVLLIWAVAKARKRSRQRQGMERHRRARQEEGVRAEPVPVGAGKALR